jgi:phosphatidylglycerophosphate synthase
LLVTLSLTFVIYCGLCAVGKTPDVGAVKHNQFFGLFLARFINWVIGPLERLLVGRVSPNAITATSLLMCAMCGVAAGMGHLGGAAWLYGVAGILDIVDGRVARLQNKQTQSGALFDSVSDRWGELFIFTGFAWLLRDTIWLFAVMGAVGSSTMVSYTRARAEGLGVDLRGGMMQRAERIVVVAAGTLVAAWYGASGSPSAADDSVAILGGAMLLVAITSTATAVGRWIAAYRVLAKRDAEQATAVAPPVVAPQPAKTVQNEIFAPVPKALRESAELPL